MMISELFINFKAHFLNTAGLLMVNFFLSYPYIFVVLKVKKKSSAPGTGTKPHFRALLASDCSLLGQKSKASQFENQKSILHFIALMVLHKDSHHNCYRPTKFV